MRIIQSFWSCNQTDLLGFKAGWFAPEYHLMSWALSCLQLRTYYNEVILYTDRTDLNVLIDKLKLPYTRVICNLDSLSAYDPQLWALGKLNSYALQETPFLHVDADVFIWEPFSNEFLENELIAQSIEISTENYDRRMLEIERIFRYFPIQMLQERKGRNRIKAFNAGIIGGHDVGFFKRYAGSAVEFIEKNAENLGNVWIPGLNIFFEQYLYFCFAQFEKKKVALLFDKAFEDIGDETFGTFLDVPHKSKYLHLVARNKNNEVICNQMADRLRNDHPDYYYRIIQLFHDSRTPPSLDRTFFALFVSSDQLAERHLSLKHQYTNGCLQKSFDMDGNKGEREIQLLDTFEIVNNVTNLLTNSRIGLSSGEMEFRISDLRLLCHSINQILQFEFPFLALDYLYGRDLNVLEDNQTLFADPANIYSKQIVADDLVRVVESRFDWTAFVNGARSRIAKSVLQFETDTSNVHTAVIPECNERGFSAGSFDELDMIMFSTLRNSSTIGDLLTELKEYFDRDEVENSQLEYEKIILDRIQSGIELKTLKLLPFNQPIIAAPGQCGSRFRVTGIIKGN